MKASTLSWWTILVGGLLFFQGLRAKGAQAAEAEVDAEAPAPLPVLEHDFGRLIGTTTREHVLRWTNPGPEPWTVLSAWEDCGCVSVVETSSGEIAPGDDLEVRIRINTSGQPAGLIEKSVHVMVGPDKIQLRGVAKADCFPQPHARPGVLETWIPAGESVFRLEGRFYVPNLQDGATIEVVDVPDNTSVEIEPIATEGANQEYTFIVDGIAPTVGDVHTFLVQIRVEGVPGLSAADELVQVACHVRRDRGLRISPLMIVLQEDGSPEGHVQVLGPDGAVGPEVEWDVEPAGALQVSYDRATGRLGVQPAQPGYAGTLSVRIPGGETTKVPVLYMRDF